MLSVWFNKKKRRRRSVRAMSSRRPKAAKHSRKINVFSILAAWKTSRFRNEFLLFPPLGSLCCSAKFWPLIICSRRNQWLASLVVVSVLSEKFFINTLGFCCFPPEILLFFGCCLAAAACSLLAPPPQHIDIENWLPSFYCSIPADKCVSRVKEFKEFSNEMSWPFSARFDWCERLARCEQIETKSWTIESV